MKKRILASMLLLGSLFVSSISYAMSFEQPVEIGMYTNTRAGGPSKAIASGYSSYSKDSFTFGSGSDSLTFKYKNNYGRYGGVASQTKGVFLGSELLPMRTIGFPHIYRIQSEDGVFYLGMGVQAGPQQVFALIGRCGTGYANAITMEHLAKLIPNLQYMDTPNAKVMGEPYSVEDKIIIPYTVRSSSEQGKLIFTWDSNAKWFGVDLVS